MNNKLVLIGDESVGTQKKDGQKEAGPLTEAVRALAAQIKVPHDAITFIGAGGANISAMKPEMYEALGGLNARVYWFNLGAHDIKALAKLKSDQAMVASKNLLAKINAGLSLLPKDAVVIWTIDSPSKAVKGAKGVATFGPGHQIAKALAGSLSEHPAVDLAMIRSRPAAGSRYAAKEYAAYLMPGGRPGREIKVVKSHSWVGAKRVLMGPVGMGLLASTVVGGLLAIRS